MARTRQRARAAFAAAVLLALAAAGAAAAPAPATAAAPSSSKAATTSSVPGVPATTPANPANPWAFAMANNVYLTKNYFIGAYHYVQCFGSELVVPANTAETADAIAYWYKRAQAGAAVTLRVSRPMFHSSSSFPCPSTPAAAAAAAAAGGSRVTTEAGAKQQGMPVSVGLLQHKLSKVLAIDPKAYTMRVGGGMRYTEFLKEAEKAGMSVQIGTPTVYAGLTLAGVLSTSGHGSGYKTTSAIWDTLLEVTWVDGTGKVHASKPTDPEFKAMVGGLGVFGVVTELLMQMTPPTATTLVTVEGDDKNMFADVQRLLKEVSPHMLLFWRPDVSKYRAYLVSKAKPGAKVEPGAVATLLPSTKGARKGATSFRLMSVNLHDDKSAFEFLCPLQTEASIGAFWASVGGKGVMNVTGPTNAMQAAECDEHCNWSDPEAFNGTAQDVELAIEWQQLPAWIDDIKKIIRMDLLEDGKASYRCLGPGYIWLRFGSGYDSPTATMSGMQAPVFVQSTWLRSRSADDAPIRYQYVLDLLEELTLCKYNGRPHWGKNFDRTFTHPKCGIRAKYPKFDSLLALQKAYDPARLFEPQLFRSVVDKTSYKLTPGCSTWMKCYCAVDANCPPQHKCVPSRAFPEYKVCKADMSDKPDTILPFIFADMAGSPPAASSGSSAAPSSAPK